MACLLPPAARSTRHPHLLQSAKLDNDMEGEPFLSNGKFTAFLIDDDKVNFKSGRILWQDGRFRHCPGRVGHTQYETMCNSLRDTTQWKCSRPEAKFAPGFAAYTDRTPDQMSAEQVAFLVPILAKHRHSWKSSTKLEFSLNWRAHNSLSAAVLPFASQQGWGKHCTDSAIFSLKC